MSEAWWKKCSHNSDWQQKHLSYGSVKLDNSSSENVQNIRQSHKIHHRTHENLEIGSNSRRKYFSRRENPERHLSGTRAFTNTMSNSNDATQLYVRNSQGATNTPNHMKRFITLCEWSSSSCLQKQMKKVTQTIQLRYRNRIWYRKMCHDHNEEWKKTNNWTAKSAMDQNPWRKGKSQILQNIKGGHHHKSGDDKKKMRK